VAGRTCASLLDVVDRRTVSLTGVRLDVGQAATLTTQYGAQVD